MRREINKRINTQSEIMVDTDYFFDVSFKTFRLVLEPSSVEIFKNWFMLSVRISSYGCTREVWRARKKRKSCSRR